MSDEARKTYWALKYVNGQQFIGRAFDHWTRGELDSALLFESFSLAVTALQSLRQEADDRLANHKDRWPRQFWWDISGGLTVVVEVERLLHVVSR